jgi:predicted ester cyclase
MKSRQHKQTEAHINHNEIDLEKMSKETQSENSADVTLANKGDLQVILSPNNSSAPAMRGFDPQFRDIIDYIVKITHEIWEERAIGRLYEYYATNMRIHMSDGEVFSRDTVIEATLQALAAFPDRRLYAEEVIWSGNDDDGYFSSHRLRHEGTNWGHTTYGSPTNKRVSYRAIADCTVVEGVIIEEWLARDRLQLLGQLGFDVMALAQRMALQEAEAGKKPPLAAESERLRGQLPPRAIVPFDSAEFDPETFVRNAIHEVWNWRLLNKVRDYYATGYVCDGSSGRNLYGQNQYITYVLSLLAPFPDMAIAVDHFCALQDDAHSYRTATRWRMTGTHTGPGIYGQPTGNRIHIMGMTHHLIKNGKLIQEWTVFDEFALLKQLCAPG